MRTAVGPPAVVGLACAVATLAAACREPVESAGDLVAYELHLTLEAHGHVRVVERARVQFDGRTEADFVLPIPRDRVDGVRGMVATVDGRPADGVAEVDLREAPGGGLTWRGRTDGPAVHEFTLEYEALGVLAVRGARGVFIWPAVPPGAGAVRAATLRLEWPDGSVPMQGPAASGEGWVVAVDGTSAMMTGRDVARGAPPVAYVDLVLDDLSGAEPAWQTREARAAELAPAFISAGLFFVVVAAGVLVMLRIRHPAQRPRGDGAREAPEDTAREIARLSAWRAPAPLLDRLVADGYVDRELAGVAHGLRLSGWVVLAVGVAGAAALALVGRGLGPAVFAMPGGLVIAAALLLAKGMTFSVLTEAGVEVAMLHSRRLAQSREP